MDTSLSLQVCPGGSELHAPPGPLGRDFVATLVAGHECSKSGLARWVREMEGIGRIESQVSAGAVMLLAESEALYGPRDGDTLFNRLFRVALAEQADLVVHETAAVLARWGCADYARLLVASPEAFKRIAAFPDLALPSPEEGD